MMMHKMITILALTEAGPGAQGTRLTGTEPGLGETTREHGSLVERVSRHAAPAHTAEDT